MREALADQVELNSLIMTENKRNWLAREAEKVRAGVASMAAAAGMNGTTALTPTTPTTPITATGDDESAIVNRSPRTDTTNNNYPVKSDAPWVALIALAVLAGAAAWWSTAPRQATLVTPAPTIPTTPAQPGTVKPASTDPNYIEFYRP